MPRHGPEGRQRSVRAAPRFLTAHWRNLAMLNFEIDPAALRTRVPAGCELDAWEGRTFVSVVGFQFLRTRVLGVPIPFHCNFEEVNLRFYVRRAVAGGWRRGVVFVKELAPRRAIAWVARWFYAENYTVLAMRHGVHFAGHTGSSRAAYEWCRRGAWEGIHVTFAGAPALPGENTEEAFITEHYWGYTARADRPTVEYEVEHPRWKLWRASSATLECDARALYGAEFAEALSNAPATAFVADGSPVIVRAGRALAPAK